MKKRARRESLENPENKNFKIRNVNIKIVIIHFFLVYFVIQRYLSKAKGKIEIQKKILDLERRALQAQMSPHFIFNALSSIQSLIAQNKNECIKT